MENGVLTVPTTLEALVAQIPIEKQTSWLQLCYAKALNLKSLTDKELQLQSLLLGYESMDILVLQTKLAEYKAGVDFLPEMRKGFTKYLDNIKKDQMQPETRAAVWEKYTLAGKRLLELKIAKEKEDSDKMAKATELEKFKTHVKNEYARILAQYQVDLSKAVTNSYSMALEDASLDEAGVQKYIQTTDTVLSEIKRVDPVKFDYKLHTKEELGPVHLTVEIPVWDVQVQKAKEYLRQTFKMYFQDRANKEAAKKYIAEQQIAQESTIKESLEKTQSVNNLMTSSAVSSISFDDGVKGLKRKTVIVIKDDDSNWAKKIVLTFTANWDVCFEYIRVKKWGNLSIAQMAAALDSAEIVVDGVQYKEEVK